MADDTPQAGTDTIATDHLTSLNGAAVTQTPTSPKVMRAKATYGDDGTSRDVSLAFPMPVGQPDATATGALAVAAATVAISLNGAAGLSVQVSGTWAGTITWEGTVNGTTWQAVNAVAASTSAPQPTTTVNGLYRLTPSGLLQVRANMTAFTSGSATVDMRSSAGAGGVYANQILPMKIVDPTTPANQGAVTAAGAQKVDGSAVTQPVSGTVALAAGAAAIGTVTVTSAPTTAVTGAFFQATQPVSATSLPLPAGAAQDGVDITTPTAMPAGGVGIRGWLSAIWTKLNGSLAVTGAFFQATQPVSLATAPTTPVTGTFFQATQPVSQAALTKGTQGTAGVTAQDLKDAGRNPVTYYTLIPVLTAAADTLQTLTGTKAAATVVATTTPAVVTAGKTFRIQRFAATYIATATSGYGVVRLRAQPAGVVLIGSPVLLTLAVGSGAPTTANAADTEDASIPDGLEVPAGTGIGISVQGFAAATGTAVGYVLCVVSGYEY